MGKVMSAIFLNYLMPLGFIVLGIYLYKVWKKPLKVDASSWDKSTHSVYLTYSIGTILCGIMFFIISQYQACNGR